MNIPVWWGTATPYKIQDCMEVMRDMPDGSVNLIIADPPYFRIKDDDWDRAHNSFGEYIAWIGEVGDELKRILADNGSMYMFGDEKNIAYMQVELDKRFVLLNNMVWHKRNNVTIKYAFNLRSYAPCSERFLFYAKGDRTGLQLVYESTDCFTEIKEYMREERRKCMEFNGFTKMCEFDEYINGVTGTSSVVSRHYFSDSQWVFPTKELYEKMQTTGFWPIGYEELRKEYEELRKEYEELRRPFNPQYGVYEVIDIPIINNGENTTHSTTKPVKLFETLIKASSNPGDIVFDPFLGSGTTLLASRRTGRVGIGCEKSEEYLPVIKKRIMEELPPLTRWFQ
ncbi:MAG: site-specific DNA-methyltransferase [Spirochaetia bacterium]|nr:site-specific DNA-methyltransferase [Spirochaetia bacterium]